MRNRIELHAKTKYSIDRESTLNIKELILKCISNGEDGVAIVDKDSVIGFYKADKILKELNIKDFKLIYGVELNVIYKKNNYNVVVLLKNKNGVLPLFRILSSYNTNKHVFLDELLMNKNNFIMGLMYDENNYNLDIFEYFDYVEVDKNINRDTINWLKQGNMVVYSNRINALSNEEELSKKILYHKINNKKDIENRVYQNTNEVLNEIDDIEIVVDNTNRIFDKIEKFELDDGNSYFPYNDDFDIELLVNIKLNEKYGDNIPDRIIKRVKEELKLIYEFNYDGYINLYKKIIDKCRMDNEEYVICDYINYLYIAYLLGIIHFDPLKLDLNYDIFFSHKASISIKVSEYYKESLLKYIHNELNIKTIRCKGLQKLDDNLLTKMISNYEDKNNIKLEDKEIRIIKECLDRYPVNNHMITFKELVIPNNFKFHKLFPRELIGNGKSFYMFTNIDYKDIEDKFITLELISNSRIHKLNELKNITGDMILNNNYKDKNIIKRKEFNDYLKRYDKNIILDEMYEDLINSDLELYQVFSIINEIRKNKNISKKTKELLDKNNIKLNKYDNINFINKGILNERARLEYELLYFKVYYSLEYYYVMLNDLPGMDLIDVIKNGYEELVNKIKDYSRYSYKYKYFNLVKEIYESDIDFIIEKRFIVEDYCFELDKENKKIVLVINKSNEEIDKYLSHDISLIGTRPMNGKMEYMSKIIYKLLDKNMDISLFGLGGNINFYIEYLLSEITGMNRKAIRQYLNPCSCYRKEIKSIDERKYLDGIKYLLYHDLSIKDYHSIDDMVIENADTFFKKIIYMITDSESDVIIIDNIECINESIKDIIKELNEISRDYNVRFIIFTNLKREYEEFGKKDRYSFKNSEIFFDMVKYISILDKEEIYVVKDRD